MRALALLLLCACDATDTFREPHPTLERMISEPRVNAYDTAMRAPPEGAVPTSLENAPMPFLTGLDHGTYLDRIPVEITRARIERGRERFEITCAACHGIDGSGRSVVAEKMSLRKPPSLHEQRVRTYPVGRIYEIIRTGYGMMPSYAYMLDADDRWNVVAYVRALELAKEGS